MQSSKFRAGGFSNTENHTNVGCNSFGYVGAVNLGSNSAMPFFNWGASYSRLASFDRRYSGSMGAIATSLTNLVADFTNADSCDSSRESYKHPCQYILVHKLKFVSFLIDKKIISTVHSEHII